MWRLIAQGVDADPFDIIVPEETAYPWWFRLGLLMAIAALAWWALQPKFDFRLNVKSGVVRCRGRCLSDARKIAIANFLCAHAPADAVFTVYGRRLASGRWTLTFRGQLDDGTQQRVRNFFTATL